MLAARGLLKLLPAFLFLAVAALAASIDGKWSGPLEGGNRDLVFQLKMDGSRVTGAMLGPNGEPRPITEGSLNGDSISLTIASEWQGSPITLLVKGKVTGDTMRVTLSTESGEWSSEATLKKAAS